MASNQTELYHLPQWEADDKILREEFNDAMERLDKALPQSGFIALWSGSVDSIPSGWALCDGENGTPDLRDRFVVGAGGGTYAVGDTGGTAADQYTNLPISNTPGSGFRWWVHYEQAQIYSCYHDNRPPYYALCFIMKL